MNSYWRTVWILFGIFIVASAAYLHRVPGLLGDEGSEGENVYELLRADQVVIEGERSYIGPLIDYVRVPFIKVFGYTPLALRMPMLLAAGATFWLAASVLKKLFGKTPALFALGLGFLNPIYLTQTRLGWAITLIPLFAFLILFLLISQFRQRALLAGLVAGIGLSNHILFLPTLLGIVFVGIAAAKRNVFTYWPALVGFIAGFAMQFVILLLQRDDQGDVGAVAKTFFERVHDVPQLLPHVLSGSSYIASYTGVGFSAMWQWMVSITIIVLVLVTLFFGQRKKVAWFWFFGLIIQTVVLLYMIDRFSLRYFIAPVMGCWLLAGIGLGVLLDHFVHLRSVQRLGPVIFGLGLVAWSAFAVLLPFLKTGGSTTDFSLGNRTDSAAALVDTRPLVACLRGAGPVFSENVHIWNRLQFLSHGYSDLEVLPEDQKKSAKYLVEYRDVKSPEAGNFCSELRHFRVVAK